MSIQVSDTIGAAGNFAVVNSKDVGGANQSVATLTDRDAIPAYLRLSGMLCYVVENAKYYSLNNDLTTWSEFSGGLASPIELYTFECAEVIAKHQLVFVDNNHLVVADYSNLDGCNMVIGVALAGKAAGESTEVVTRGMIIEPAWNWAVKSLFLGSNGQFSTALPSSPGLLWKVAQVTSSQTIFFNPRNPLIGN